MASFADSLFGDDDLFGEELFGDGLGGGDELALTNAGPEDPGLASLTFPAAHGGLSLPEIPGPAPCPALPETTVGTPAQSQEATTRPWEGPSEVELLAPQEPLTLPAPMDLLGALGESDLAVLGPAVPVDAASFAIELIKASDLPGLQLNNAQTRKEVFLSRRLDHLDDPHLTDLLSLGSNTSVYVVTERLGLSGSNGNKIRKAAMDCLAKSDFSYLLENMGRNKGKGFAQRYKTQLWTATRYLLEARGFGRRWFDGITTSILSWQQDSTLIAINFFSLLHKSIKLQQTTARIQDSRKANKQISRTAGSLNPTPRVPRECPTKTLTDNSVEPLGESLESIEDPIEPFGDPPTTIDDAASMRDLVEHPEDSFEPMDESTSLADPDEPIEGSEPVESPEPTESPEPSIETEPFSVYNLVEPFDNLEDFDPETLYNFLEACKYSADMMDLGENSGVPDVPNEGMDRLAEGLEGLVDDPAPAHDYMPADFSDDGYDSSFDTSISSVESDCDFDTSDISVEPDLMFDTSYTSASTFRTSISSVSPATQGQPPSPESAQSYQLRLGSFVDAVSSKAKEHHQVAGCRPENSTVPANARIRYLFYVFSQATGQFLDESLDYTHQDIPPGTGITQLKTMMETAGCFPSFQVFTPKGRRDIDSQSTWDEAILDIFNGRELEETQVVVHMFV